MNDYSFMSTLLEFSYINSVFSCVIVVTMYSTLQKCVPVLLAVFTSVKSFVADDYSNVLQNSNLDLSFSALQISNLLENEKFDSSEFGEKCAKDLMFYRTGIQNREIWAMKMLDASSKVQAGILKGNLIDLGNYDECVAINYAEVKGKYCTYSLSVDDNNTPTILIPTLSFCLPVSCDLKELELLVNRTIKINPIFKKSRISPGFAMCSRIEPLKWSRTGIISVSLLAIFSLFIVSCTVLEVLGSPQMKEKGFFNIIIKFSMYKNGRKILSTKASPNILPALQGIRCLSMLWVFLGHQYIAAMAAPSINTVELADWMTSWRSTFIFIAPLSVDSFLTISGFLTSYLFFTKMAQGKNFNIFQYYIHRYVRLTPPIIVMLIFAIYLFPRLGSGPAWDLIVNFASDACYQNWWAISLYLQNTVNKKNTCLMHVWYLAVDMQLFWISPLILYSLARKPKMGLTILGLFFLSSIVIPILIYVSGDYNPILYDVGMSYESFLNQFSEFYTVTYARAAPWIVGIYFGYEMATKKPRKFSKIEARLVWFMTIMAVGFCTYGYHIIRHRARPRNMIFEMIYVGLSKPLWGVVIAWIIYACTNGYGGIVNRILSLPIFSALSKIAYSFYLVHVGVQMIRVSIIRSPSYFSLYNVMSVTLLDMAISLVLAFVFSLLFESPILILEKMILKENLDEENESGKQLCSDNSKKKMEEKAEKVKKNI